jgi:hypothetical protein
MYRQTFLLLPTFIHVHMKQWRDWPDGNHFIILMVPPKKIFKKNDQKKLLACYKWLYTGMWGTCIATPSLYCHRGLLRWRNDQLMKGACAFNHFLHSSFLP